MIMTDDMGSNTLGNTVSHVVISSFSVFHSPNMGIDSQTG